MKNILNVIKEKYLIGCQSVELLENGNILFIEDDGGKQEQTKKEFINDYIDFLTDLLNQKREDKEYTHCMDILDDLKALYDGLAIISMIQ